MLDEQSFFILKTAVPCYRGQQLRNNILVKLLLALVAGHSFLRYIELSASSRKWPGLPKPLPLGEVALRSNDGEGKPAGGSRSGFPSYNLSVSLRSTAPLVGEPLAKPFTLRGLPKPLPLGEVSPKVTERASPARKSRCAAMVRFPFVQPLSLAALDSSPGRGASGETVHFAGTAKASPTRGGGTKCRRGCTKDSLTMDEKLNFLRS